MDSGVYLPSASLLLTMSTISFNRGSFRNISNRVLDAVCREAGLIETVPSKKPGGKSRDKRTICLYDLRHTCATLMLSAGVNPKVASERLGHSTVVITLDTYSHVLPDIQKDATDKIGKTLYR